MAEEEEVYMPHYASLMLGALEILPMRLRDIAVDILVAPGMNTFKGRGPVKED